MRIESKLCHISENKAVVQVYGWQEEKALGSAIAEGPTVEVAEDRAISRLYKRLNIVMNNEKTKNSTSEKKITSPIKEELAKNNNMDINNEPSDWSNELTAIDSEIERLKWSRDDEINFLKKSLGYNNRNKITNYNDILKYLNFLKNTPAVDPSQVNKDIIKNLIDESDILLRDLSWDNIKGREFLEKEFNVSTRKELNKEQLMSFVAKLKTLRNQNLPY